MTEPAIPPIREPKPGGWPRLMVRLEAVYAPDLCRSYDLAYYELALAARELRRGVVACIAGVDVTAFPHQTTNEIARGHLHAIRAMAQAAAQLQRHEVAA